MSSEATVTAVGNDNNESDFTAQMEIDSDLSNLASYEMPSSSHAVKRCPPTEEGSENQIKVYSLIHSRSTVKYV